MKKTLMFYINSIRGGGAERVMLEVAQFFSQIGYRSILVTSFVAGEAEYPVPKSVERISIERGELRGSFLMRNIRRIVALRRICEEYRPAVLISFMGEPNLRALIATLGLPTKNVISVRTNPEDEYNTLFRRFMARCLFPRAEGCVFQTREAMSWFAEDVQRKAAIILNPVKPIFFDTERALKPKNIVAIGRLEKEKNFLLLIDAFAKIAFKYPLENLLIFGQGTMREELQTHIETLNLESRVKLMGATKDVAGELARAKLFVLSSDSEGLPNALMEAMAMGVPVIATDCPCGGPRMLIEDGVSGRLVPMRCVIQMAQAMDATLSDEVVAEHMGCAAKTRAKEQFRPSQVLEAWKSYVEEIIRRNA